MLGMLGIPTTNLSNGDDELARPEVGEEEVESCVAHVVRVGEGFHSDLAGARVEAVCRYLELWRRGSRRAHSG